MDRKAWIIVTLCCALAGLNFWYMQKDAAYKQKIAAEAFEKKKKEQAAQPAAVAPAAAAVQPAPAVPAGAPEETRELKSGSATFVFTSHGGGVKKAVLSGKDQVVLNQHGKDAIGAFRREAKLSDDIVYRFVEATEKSVTMEGEDKSGLLVRKTFQISEGDPSDEHLLKLNISVTNKGASQHTSEQHFLYTGAAASLRPDDILHPAVFWNDTGDAYSHDTNWFQGGMFSSAKTELAQDLAQLHYGGVMSRFYVNMLSLKTKIGDEIPGKIWAERFLIDHANDEFKGTTGADKDYAIHGAVSLPKVDLAPGATQSFDFEVYLGPKEYHRLSHLGEMRTGIMFYGWTKPVSVIFVNLMRWLHDAVGNWGLAIILMTIIVRLCTWPVFASSMRQAKRMGKLQPLMKELQEKYKDDQQRQSQEMMKLYKDYGFNPLGCVLPMVIQILVFSGFYRVLQVAAELRGQGFWWVHDLSLPDTVAQFMGFHINPLPILMGLSTIIQMKLTPQAPSVDKSQQRMMMFMPIIFVFICYNFAAALALYYTTQNVFGIFQSWAMRKMDKDDGEPLKKVEKTPMGPPPQSLMFQQPGQKPKKNKPRGPKLGG
jgi:YidC/Oxa1 family membrane protein insertase